MKKMSLKLAMESWRNNNDNIDDLTNMIDKLVGHDYAIMTLVFEYGKEMAAAATTVQRAGFDNDQEMLEAWMLTQDPARIAIADKEKT